MKAIQELLGHSDIRTTMRYAHLAPSTLKDTVSLLEADRHKKNFGQYVGNEPNNFSQILELVILNNTPFLPDIKQKQEPKFLLK